MKYLKKFNEELKPSTYRSAAYKLKKLGHKKRSDDLTEWSNKADDKESYKKWKENKERFKKYGVFKFRTGDKVIECYIHIIFMREAFEDSYEFGGSQSLPFSIMLIPCDDEGYNFFKEKFEDYFYGYLTNVFLWISFEMSDNKIQYKDIEFDADVEEELKINGRATAGRLKRLLSKMFTEDFGKQYDSGYNDYDDFYNMVDEFVGARLGLSADYGFTPEQVSKFISSYSANKMY